MNTYNTLEKEIESIEKKSALHSQYISDCMNNKTESNIFVRKTRENITAEFFDNLDVAIQNPLN